MTMYFQRFVETGANIWTFTRNFYRIVEFDEVNMEFHEKRLLLTF